MLQDAGHITLDRQRSGRLKVRLGKNINLRKRLVFEEIFRYTYYISVFTVLPQQIQIELLGMVFFPGSGKEGVKRDAASSNGTIKGF